MTNNNQVIPNKDFQSEITHQLQTLHEAPPHGISINPSLALIHMDA